MTSLLREPVCSNKQTEMTDPQRPSSLRGKRHNCSSLRGTKRSGALHEPGTLHPAATNKWDATHGAGALRRCVPRKDGRFFVIALPMTDPQKSLGKVASRRDASPGRKNACPFVAFRRNAPRPWLVNALQNGRARSSKDAILTECKGGRCAVLPGDASLRDAIRTQNASPCRRQRTLRGTLPLTTNH
jgi:hypothetical protein